MRTHPERQGQHEEITLTLTAFDLGSQSALWNCTEDKIIEALLHIGHLRQIDCQSGEWQSGQLGR